MAKIHYYHTLSLNSYTDINLKYRLAFKFIMKKYTYHGKYFSTFLLNLKPPKNNLIMHVTTDLYNYMFIPNNTLATNSILIFSLDFFIINFKCNVNIV